VLCIKAWVHNCFQDVEMRPAFGLQITLTTQFLWRCLGLI
jgi:hypothetical protein